jgi:hypothetical protein
MRGCRMTMEARQDSGTPRDAAAAVMGARKHCYATNTAEAEERRQ